MRVHRILTAAAVVLFALWGMAAPGIAQSPPRDTGTSNRDQSIGAALRRSADKHGLWGAVGVGRAEAGLHCDACTDKSSRAYSIYGTVGLRLSSRALVGAEMFGWLDAFGGGVDKIARGSYLVGRLYASDQSRLFLQGGVGVASYRVNDGEVAFSTRSPSVSLSAGYDWRVDGFSISPSLSAIGSTGGRFKSDKTGNAIADNARLLVLRTGIAVSWFR